MKKILVMGGHGFVGKALILELSKLGYELQVLTRSPKPNFEFKQFQWDGFTLPTEAVEDVYAVINLVGESIADKPWTESQKEKILSSRVNSVKALHEALRQVLKKPKVILQTSAVGFYGSEPRSDLCAETASSGKGFLAETTKAWEGAFHELQEFSEIRFCFMRLGVVFGHEGGAFPKLKRLYTFGMGATLGSGLQWMNWIHIDDVVGFSKVALEQEGYFGPYNLVSPVNLKNKDFHSLLSSMTLSFDFMKVPSLLIKALLGSRSELVLGGPKVLPERLLSQGFRFQLSSPKRALKNLLY